jgi:5-oxoprolinase (ATP-hydrolysing)
MDGYLDRIEAECGGTEPLVMSSSGGLVPRRRFHAVDSLVSGPAGGLAGAVAAARSVGWSRMIALDMGGTSTDVSRWNNGFELRKEVRVGPARLLLPALPIETVAAGGGSICHVVDNRLQVGPRSAGADPGPAAYGNGGPLTLTDVHLVLGRLDAQAFRIPLDIAAAHAALDVVSAQLGEADRIKVAEGCLQLAAESMAAAIGQVSLREGADPADYGMVAFGGAGGLQACEVATRLGMDKVLLPADAGLLSAAGIRAAAREVVTSRQLVMASDEAEPVLPQIFADMGKQAAGQLERDGVASQLQAPARCRVHVRLRGQEHSIALQWPLRKGIVADFRDRFTTQFGFWPDAVALEVVQLDLVLSEKLDGLPAESFPESDGVPPALRYQDAWFDAQRTKLPVYDRNQLHPGVCIHGPALVYDTFSSCIVAAGWRAVLGERMSLLMSRVGKETHVRAATLSRGIRSSLVCNRFEAMVEAMGEQLRRSALSTNIRERLDFSCALLDADGRLLVNAPHIPVHLGALGLCVRSCRALLELRPGDVVLTNHPAHGGSHLPDVTVFSGIFDADGRLHGYLANRAHHAEIGGKAPGSMPADGQCLADEGVVIPPMYLLRNDNKQGFDVVEKLLRSGPSPSRQPEHNLADLAAQVASLRQGQAAFSAILDEFGSADIAAAMALLDANARDAGKAALRKVRGGSARTALDDGSVIAVALRNNGERLQVDFSGSAPVHRGNLNATPAIVRSTVLYFVRLLVDQPIPLGEALLDGVDIVLPEGMLHPPFDRDPVLSPAVVGGNVETSQKITEALLQVAGIVAASQGTMNNLLFGNASFGYYETIGGGAGAGDGFPGASGVHVHMTNTAITDPEILELRYPVICREFSLREGSGGSGRWSGGDGLVRELEFRQPVTVSLLTQSRNQEPSGLNGGGNGKAGRNFKVAGSGNWVPLPGICQVQLQAGEGIRLETPGGGGYGKMP